MTYRYLLALCLSILITSVAVAVEITNPYAAVDWQWHQHRANLHTHTTESDGRWSPARTIDAYHELGYTILALTDHNRVTYPWSEFDRDPEDLDMLAVQGNELSRGHHVGSYFSDNRAGQGLEGNVAEVGEAGGIAVVFHPGRYTRRNQYDVDDYVALYREHPHAVGIEIVNQRDRYPEDRDTWDAILTRLMPERPVWGLANDDFHRPNHLGYSWTVFPLPQLTLERFREAMVGGAFYSVARDMTRSEQRDEDMMPPAIRSITVEDRTITIDAEDAEGIVWIAAGEKVHRGPSVQVRPVPDLPGYVRAEFYNPGGTTYTNPFGLRREPRGPRRDGREFIAPPDEAVERAAVSARQARDSNPKESEHE